MPNSVRAAAPPIAWDSIRPYPDRKASFEKLCAQLLNAEPHASDAIFQRQGLNDKGCEALWRSPSSGDVAVQAKYFLQSPGDAEFGQVDKSVKTALANFPDLVRYIVCLPTDLSDTAGKRNGKRLKTARDRWNDHRATWAGWAKGRPKPIEFVLWDAHELEKRVQTDVGIAYYFFGKAPLTLKWASAQFQSTLDLVQKRYTPELNVELPLSRAADALLRSDRYLDTVFDVYRTAEKAIRQINPSAYPEGALRERVRALCDEVLGALGQILVLEEDRHGTVDWPAIGTAAVRCASELGDRYLELPMLHRYDEGYASYENAGHQVRTASSALRQFAYFAQSTNAQLATNPVMILVGDAGTGKTHFLCDVLERALAGGHFGLMMLSEQFGESDPLAQLIAFYGLTCTTDEFLGALNSLAVASGRGRSLLVIDALNEAPSDAFWKRSLARLMRAVQKYSYVGLIVSLRSDHQSTLLDDVICKLGVTVHHDGFSYELFEAQRIYFAAYKIQPPGPLLSREYQIPLYLKTLCDTLQAEGLNRIPAGHRSIIQLFNRYMIVMGKRIAEALGEDPDGNFASRAIASLADAYAAHGTRLMPYDTAEAIVQAHQHYPAKEFRKSLFGQLISANVLAVTTNATGARMVRFMFEKIADHAIAERLIENAIAAKGEAHALEDAALLAALNPTITVGFRANTLNALVLQIPERLGIEIADTAAGELARYFALNALSSRWPRSITSRTAAIVSEALARPIPAEQMWDDDELTRLLDTVVALATVPGHPLDAKYLHQYLMAMTLPARDVIWSVRVNHADPDHTLSRILAWARATPLAALDQETKVGLATIMCWMTSSSNQTRRDHATKVLAQLIAGAPAVARQLLADFQGCNDPYVVERLLCAIYGGALMSPSMSDQLAIASAVYASIFESSNVPVHLLSREYARLAVQLAVDAGLLAIDPATFSPPYGAAPATLPKPDLLDWKKTEPARSEDEQAVLAVRHSLGDSGDFARYIVGTNWQTFPFINTRLTSDAPISRPIAERMFTESLDEEQRSLERASHFPFWNDSPPKVEKAKAMAKAVDAAKRFAASLSSDQLRLQELARTAEVSPSRVNLTAVCNWLFARVKKLGLASASFSAHDGMVRRGAHGRDEADDIERIGKKYQWIAYYELLARYADNFWMQSARHFYDRDYVRFDSTAELGKRNIDPTVFLPLTSTMSAPPWWIGDPIEKWEGTEDLAQWLRRETLPDPEKLLRVRDRTGTDWLSLDTAVSWTQPSSRAVDNHDNLRAQIVYQLRSFVVKAEDADAVEAAFLDKPLRETRRVDDVSAGDIFLQELPVTYFARQTLPTTATFEEVAGVKMFPATVHVRAFDRDAAAGDFSTIAPSPLLASLLQLDPHTQNVWRDASGVTAFDPSNGSAAGPPALLIRDDIVKRLDPAYELCWVLTGENRVVGGMGRFVMPGRVEVAGFWRLKASGSPVGAYRRDWVPASAPTRGSKKKQGGVAKRPTGKRKKPS